MSLLDAGIKKDKSVTQFFQTLPEQVEALYWNYFVEISDNKDLTILDAGSGKGRIARRLQRYGLDVKTCDNVLPAHYMIDFLDFDEQIKFDVVVSNPPYTRAAKYKFLDKALRIAETAIFLYPLQCLNYIDFCSNYLDTVKYKGRITMYPKVILNKEGSLIQGGNTGYGWFVFTNEHNKRAKTEILCDTRVHRHYGAKAGGDE